MKEAQVAKDLSVTIKDVAVPEPQANQVVIKVVYSGSNPKDWYVYFPNPPCYLHDHNIHVTLSPIPMSLLSVHHPLTHFAGKSPPTT